MRIVLVTVLLASAALAGCAAGGDETGQLPTDVPASHGGQGDDPGTSSERQNRTGHGNDGWRGDLRLEVEPKRGQVPLNVTIRYDVDDGRHGASPGAGGSGNATAGNQTATGNQTANGNQAGNGTSGAGNLTWNLRMWRMTESEAEQANETAAGNSTGNQTGNSTTSSTTGANGTPGNGTSTSTGTGSPSGNSTGNSTGNQTGNATSDDDGFGNDTTAPSGPGNLTLSVNGTMADLPGYTVQGIEAEGHYMVRFSVTFDNGSTTMRTATVHARGFVDGDPLGNETQTFEGSFVAADPLVCLGGSEDFDWVLNSTFGDHPARVSRLNATLASNGVMDSYELVLLDENETELARGKSIQLNETAPGNYTLRVESCPSVDTEFTVTAIADYVYSKVAKTTGDTA